MGYWKWLKKKMTSEMTKCLLKMLLVQGWIILTPFLAIRIVLSYPIIGLCLGIVFAIISWLLSLTYLGYLLEGVK